ncbi:MAG: aromatic amino acid hydroxylase [Bdellovibrionales bacterium]|nr:aromatic amino acid hydroxylase [Bdellovibrionales bacterium]
MTSAPDFVPDYLKPFIANQDASLYTSMDHASWRFILRASRDFFAKHAHPKYLAGLEETGISSERIPLVSEMDEKLRRFGWRAVPVSGFIPPAVFMEFQSLGILPIACEMRTIEHLAYTPAPDIVHEAAGHAPIIADPEYSAYLRAYGEISRKAIFSYQDMGVYEAVRNLSIVKEDPKSTESDIARAQSQLDAAVAAVTFASEATYMARMNWWTVEYGLVGSLSDPKIYGAGLLSSLGESYHCLGPDVARQSLTLDCVNTAYDITKPQPQLFVAKDFHHLTKVLREFSEGMAFRTGGKTAVEKAVQARTVCTVVLDSGIQFSGVVDSFREADGKLAAIRLSGPTQLAYGDRELPNQGPTYHREGFSTVIGKLRGMDKSPAFLTDSELAKLDTGGMTVLEFASGVRVVGKITGKVRQDSRLVILSFADCTVTHGTDILFRPEWGTFDLACGEGVVSVFGGAADRKAYVAQTGGFRQSPMNPKSNLTPENRELNDLYARIRILRESPAIGADGLVRDLADCAAALDRKYPDDWLARLEVLELLAGRANPPPASVELERSLRARLSEIRKLSRDRDEMIARGLALLERGSS